MPKTIFIALYCSSNNVICLLIKFCNFIVSLSLYLICDFFLFFVYSGAVFAPLVFCLDPNRDPNAEKSRWIQADTVDRPPSRKHAKAPESVAAQRFPALIVSSHAGGHWFESSNRHPKYFESVVIQAFFV